MAQARGVLGSTPGDCRPFHLLYFHLITFISSVRQDALSNVSLSCFNNKGLDSRSQQEAKCSLCIEAQSTIDTLTPQAANVLRRSSLCYSQTVESDLG